MMNRRQFVSAAAGAAIFSRATSVLAAQGGYDLIIKGGRVIDPSVRLDAVRDLAISGGRIVAVETIITASAAMMVSTATDRKSTRLNSSHSLTSRMPSSA